MDGEILNGWVMFIGSFIGFWFIIFILSLKIIDSSVGYLVMTFTSVALIFLFKYSCQKFIISKLLRIWLLNTTLSKEISNVDSIDSVLSKIQTIKISLLYLRLFSTINFEVLSRMNTPKLKWVKKYSWFNGFEITISTSKYTDIDDYGAKIKEIDINQSYISFFRNEYSFLLEILQNLRSDLTLRLAEQQKTLESAKSEVEKNISWTPELNAVSELQKSRLDRQIEQFETLQRVLVEV